MDGTKSRLRHGRRGRNGSPAFAAAIGAVLLCFTSSVAMTIADEAGEAVPASSDDETANLADSKVNAATPFEPLYRLLNWNQPQPLPIAPAPTPLPTEVQSPDAASRLSGTIFSAGELAPSLLSEARRARATAPGTNVVFGSEAWFRSTTDVGNLLGKSPNATNVRTQTRSRIVNDPRVRGDRIGRLLASGSYWVPARQDLDTMVSRIDSRLIEDIIVIKGPYAVRYGPGHDFADMHLLGAPRYTNGYETHGSTSFDYKTNGQPIYGRTNLWGGSDDWGFRVGYGHATANDYYAGNGFDLPASYVSRDLNFSVEYDLSSCSRIEFTYLRLDQTDVEYPGLVFDINALVTDGFDLKYSLEDQTNFDLFALDIWYNKTRFTGDTFRNGKNRQIPSLRAFLQPIGMGEAITDVDSQSTGYRASLSWGDPDANQLTVGTDLILINQQLNDIQDPAGTPLNSPIPRSHSNDVGIFTDYVTRVTDATSVTLGGRLDWVSVNARNTVPDLLLPYNAPAATISGVMQSGLDQHFALWSLFITADHQINEFWTLTAGAGHGQRPPTLAELYATGSFIGTLQPGLNFLQGDPQVDAEKRTQVDLGIHADFDRVRMSLNGFHAWIHDYITYDQVFPIPQPGVNFQSIAVGNTDLATLTGFEFAAEADLNCWLTALATVGYVEGRDYSRNRPFRMAEIIRADAGAPGFPRSVVFNRPEEPLPGIPPLETRLGIRLHQPCQTPKWLVELEARVVDQQDRVAASLLEAPTPGFTVWNVRGYWAPAANTTIVAGVENFGDKFYREHLDYRSGLGVFQPGANFYVGVERTY